MGLGFAWNHISILTELATEKILVTPSNIFRPTVVDRDDYLGGNKDGLLWLEIQVPISLKIKSFVVVTESGKVIRRSVKDGDVLLTLEELNGEIITEATIDGKLLPFAFPFLKTEEYQWTLSVSAAKESESKVNNSTFTRSEYEQAQVDGYD